MSRNRYAGRCLPAAPGCRGRRQQRTVSYCEQVLPMCRFGCRPRALHLAGRTASTLQPWSLCCLSGFCCLLQMSPVFLWPLQVTSSFICDPAGQCACRCKASHRRTGGRVAISGRGGGAERHQWGNSRAVVSLANQHVPSIESHLAAATIAPAAAGQAATAPATSAAARTSIRRAVRTAATTSGSVARARATAASK